MEALDWGQEGVPSGQIRMLCWAPLQVKPRRYQEPGLIENWGCVGDGLVGSCSMFSVHSERFQILLKHSLFLWRDAEHVIYYVVDCFFQLIKIGFSHSRLI